MALHGLLVVGAVSATVSTTTSVAPTIAQHVVYVPPQPDRPHIAPPRSAMNPLDAVPGVISVPISVPDRLAIADPARVSGQLLPTTPFVPGLLTTPGAPPLPAGATYLVEQVEVPVAIEKGSPIPRFPAAMRSANVEGTVRFRFVVDTLGRVEMGTVRELESTHEAFAFAVRATLPRMRFTPARIGGHPVRQLVEFPVVFKITR